jgi:DNA-binding response OmpR family regulator
MQRSRILVVDDDPHLRAVLAATLESGGYTVVSAATVSEALREISRASFDALISDLNIGEPGDGFTVVSAMRRSQPYCVTFILTGYPAFETALEAIRSQVDDYLVKPTKPTQLLACVAERLANPTRTHRRVTRLSVAEMLRAKSDDILMRARELMRDSTTLRSLPLTEEQRVEGLPEIIAELVVQLASSTPEESTAGGLKAASAHGRVRRSQGYTPEMLAEDSRLLGHAIHDVIETNLLDLGLSSLVSDLRRVNDTLSRELEVSIQAYMAVGPAAAAGTA